MKRFTKFLPMTLLCLFVFTACDNAKGPFSYKLENGVKVLYSGDKPAKGNILNKNRNRDGVTTTLAEIYYDKGVPAGKFKLYSTKGVLLVDADGKWDGSMFTGKIKEPTINGEGKGTFSINRAYLMDYSGQNLYDTGASFANSVLYDGHVKSDLEEISRVKGERDGVFKTFYSPGVIKYEGTYKNGKENGKFISYDTDGSIYEEKEMKNGKNDGKSVNYDLNGNPIVIQYYKDGKLNGPYTRYRKDGSISINATYKDDKYNGVVTEYDQNGNKITEYTYVDGVKNGLCIDYDLRNGSRHEYMCKGKDNNGPYKKYNKEGILIEEGQYVHNQKDGEIKKYYENTGKLLSEVNYIEGRPDGLLTIYDEDGNKSETWEFENGVENGEYISYFPSGAPHILNEVRNGVFSGPSTTYFENGEIHIEGFYDGGVPHGHFTEYNEKGEVIKEREYYYGSIVE